MKKYVTKLTAAFMAVAMLLSLTVAASAGNVQSLTNPSTQTSSENTVTNQGAVPDDVINIVVPTAANGGFSMLFDSHGLIAESAGARYASVNSGAGATFESGSRFFFTNITPTAVEAKATVGNDVTGTDSAVVVANGTVADVYQKTTLTKIYAKYTAAGAFEKWIDAGGNDCTYESGVYAVVSPIKDLDPKLGAGLDAIAKLNKDTLINFVSTGAKGGATPVAIKDLDEYSFNAYDTTDLRYVANGKVLKVEGSAYALDSSFADVTALTTANGSGVSYTLQKTVQNITSYTSTSDTIEVINKSNSTIGLKMKAELTGIADSTYTYAADYSDGKFMDSNGDEITDTPVLYFALSNKLNGEAQKTVAMTYADSKGTVEIDTKLAGKRSFFSTKWDGTNNEYYYEVDPAKRNSDFDKMEFNFKGQINEDDGWDTLASTNGSSGPAMTVTWTVQEYTPTLTTPTLSAGALNLTKVWIVTVDGNDDKATIASV